VKTSLENAAAAIYCADEHDYRRKQCGLRLSDQLLISIDSLRSNWSKHVDVYVFHTGLLSERLLRQLEEYRVKVVHGRAPLRQEYLLANKILVGRDYQDRKDILFLDCDTRFHRGLTFDSEADIVVAYDALQAIAHEEYQTFFECVNVPMPNGLICKDLAYQYYCHGVAKQFPQFNSGVFFLKKRLQKLFYDEWETIFLLAYEHFRMMRWAFYLEQLSFTAAILKLDLNYKLFPPGINFICTPRAPDLCAWPREQISLEHYAGDTSRPLVFAESKIDLIASGIALPPKIT